jgi:hypothetical protein
MTAVGGITSLYLLFSFAMFARADAPPVISNVTMKVDLSRSVVTVGYDVNDPEGEALRVACTVSDDDGRTFLYPAGEITGDVGYPIIPGAGKEIQWFFDPQLVDLSPTAQSAFRLKIIADDSGDVSIPDAVGQVSSSNLSDDLLRIEGVRHTAVNPSHHETVKNLLFTRFANLGLQVREAVHPTAGINVIGRLAGHTEETITYIVDAHYDTVSGSPGADDNGSGVVGMLEVARVLGQLSFERTVVFIGFDQEEQGLLGSKAYVQSQQPSFEEIAGVLNFEMIGYWSDQLGSQVLPSGFDLLFPEFYAAVLDDSSRGNFIASIANSSSNPLRNTFDKASATYVPSLRCLSLAVPGNGEIAPDLRRSDHSPFWDAGYQALMLTDTAEFRNRNYHSASDTAETLNLGFLADVVRATVATVMELAGPIQVGVAITERVVASPDLRLRITAQASDTILLEWDESASGMTLQRTGSLESGLWEDLGGSGETNSVSIRMGTTTEFYRLVGP